MKKTLIILFIAGHSALSFAQDTFKTSKGEIEFNASTPLEDIHAVNKVVNAILKTATGDFASVLLMKDFNFKRSLMQEHFNENYVESETYPKAHFSGKIQNFKAEDLSSTPKEYEIKGKMTIHGVTKTFSAKANLSRKSGSITLDSRFIIKPEEYKIKVPKLLFKKIAQEVKVDIKFPLVSS